MFGGLFGKKKKDSDEQEACKLSPAISQSIVGVVGAKSIPPMPAAAQKAFQLATDPKADARDFTEVIESDEGLSARVIKIANSVYFDRGKPSKTIEESVIVIGINELRCLLNATTLSEIFPCGHPARAQLWANDIATALISRMLCQRTMPAKAESAFLGGLMHDVGKLLLLQRAGEDYSRVVKQVEASGIDFCDAEIEVFVFNHTEVGQLIGERWNFSPELISIIRNHHDAWPESVPKGDIPLPLIVKAADLFAHGLGLGHPKTFGKLRSRSEESFERAFSLLAIEPAEQKELLTNLQKTYELEFDLYSGKGMK